MSKSTLAALSAVVAIGLAALSVWTHGHPAAILGSTGAALGLVLWGVPASPRRNALLMMTLAAGSGALFFHFDSFWGLFVCGFVFVWSLFGLVPAMDGVWRLKLGFVAAVFAGAFVILWPTIRNLSGGRVPLPAYFRDRVTNSAGEQLAIAPGLDLRGGIRLVYTVEVEDAIRDKRDHFRDEMREELATVYGFHKEGSGRVTPEEMSNLEDKVHIAAPEKDTAAVILKFADKADKAKIDDRFAKRFLNEMAQTQGPGEDEITFKIRSDIESQIRDRAVAQAKDTVSRRIDGLGLKEAAVTTRDEDIIVEVPGTDEKTFLEIKNTIRTTARLEFKMVDDPASAKVFKDVEVPADEGIEVRELDRQPDGMKDGKKAHTVGRRARIACQPAKYPKETLKECLERFKEWARTINVPDDHIIGFEAVTEPVPNTDPQQFKQVGWFTEYMWSKTELTGDYIVDANIGQDQQKFGQYYVSLSFSPQGSERFEEVTGANVNRRFAIILDDEVKSAPVIIQKISGNAQISMGAGDPDKQIHDARELQLVLQSGALPAPMSPSNESLIGPSLGKDAIDQGVKGMFFGSIAVLAFMLFYYRKSGVVADVAVLFNLMLQMAVLATFGASMTLPGIAGLALTLGMSIDVNVLINERIREELRAGKSVRQAVDQGYDRAWPSIVDGHVTVLITGLILAQYGSGPVKGFAFTLIVGILCSLFTGFFCTRIVFDWWVRGAKVKRLSVGAEF